MTLINGTGIGSSALNENQKACLDAAMETVDEARKGNIHAMVIVVCVADGYASVMVGNKAADLNLGLDSAKRKILSAIEDDGNRKQARSSILRAR